MGIANLRQTLANYQSICVDTMIFIYLLDANPHYSSLATTVFEMIELGELRGVTSTLTLAEILTAPARQGNNQVMQNYELYLTNFPNLTLVPPDVGVARLAAISRANFGLKMPDAIQIATALYTGADAIVSNDKQWRNKITKPTLILLDDYL